MSRLIDADALQSEYMRYHDGKRIVLVDVAPTIEERKKGKWIYFESESDRYEDIKCPFCKKSYTVDVYRRGDIGFTAEDFNYCPNCGARMEGER